MLVDLPDPENREKILRVILAKENLAPEFKLSDLAAITEGFSGSDLKNLCISCAYIPIREFLQAEQKEKSHGANSSNIPSDSSQNHITNNDLRGATSRKDKEAEESPTASEISSNSNASIFLSSNSPAPIQTKPRITLRPLKMVDFEMAMKEISASVSEDAYAIAELRKWNEMYGEGGSRTKTSLSYFM